jgi:hypothetical protein
MKTRKLSRLVIAVLAVFALADAVPALAQRGGGGGGHGSGFHGGGGAFHGAGAFHGGARGYAGGGGYRGGGYGRPAYGGGYEWGGRGYGGGGGYGWGDYGGAGWLGYGLLFSTLPLAYATYYWEGVPYYYAHDNYYQWDGTAGGYETVRPPAEVISQTAADPQAQLYAYPTNGQSDTQQTKDRSDCQQWAAGQAGTHPATHANYLRAEAACMTGNGYSIR